jgi:NADH dehydrogenase [ubiquinone] 1 alpha subcomplex assembly factor 1
MFTLNTLDDISQFGKGSDADIGGLSTVNLTLEERPEINQPIGKEATGVFWGDMKLKVKPGMEGRIRGGYAGIKSKVCPRRVSQFPYGISHAPRFEISFRIGEHCSVRK